MKKIAGALLNYFVKGLLIVVPLGVAIFLVLWSVSSLDRVLNLSGILLTDSKGNPLYIPGLGILNVIIIILVAGVLVTNVITEPIKQWFNRWLNRLPLFKFLYHRLQKLP